MQTKWQILFSRYFVKLWLLSLLVCQPIYAATMPLPAEQAFKLTTSFLHKNEVQLSWEIAPGYYLYAKKMQFKLPKTVKADIHMPQGVFQSDKTGSRYEAFAGRVNIPITLQTFPAQFHLEVNYQGCSKAGFCYPPMSKNFQINLIQQTIIESGLVAKDTAITTLLTNQQDVKSFLATKHFSVMLLIFTGLGLLLAFTPCVLPMIPILTGIIVGHHAMNTRKAFFLSCGYVFGMACAYALIGFIAALMGNSLQVWLQKPWIIAMTGGLFALLALSLFGLYELRLPNRLQNQIMMWSGRQKGGDGFGVFIMGALSTLIVSPCVTAPLVGVLLYIAETGRLLYGALALFMLGIGMGLPLLVIGSSVGKWIPKSGPWMEAVKQSFGLLMLAMAIWLISRILSPTFATLLWGIFLILVAIFISIYVPKWIGRHRLNRIIGLSVATCGAVVMLGSVNSNSLNVFRDTKQVAATEHSFVIVRNLADLNKQLQLAHAANRPVILDFYADWCESCIEMDKKVFALSDVQHQIKNYILLRADLSANTPADEVLLKHFNVIAPPTVLFFDNKGQEINSKRIVGEVSAGEFLNRLYHPEVVNAS